MTFTTQPDIDLMKRVNRQFVTGVTVVTAMDGQTPARPGGECLLEHFP